MTGCNTGGRTVSVVVRGTSGAVVAEAARSLHDALCAVRCVARRPALLPGGGAPEAAAAAALARASQTAPGADHYCLRAYADALEVVPSTLAENAGIYYILDLFSRCRYPNHVEEILVFWEIFCVVAARLKSLLLPLTRLR